MLFSYSRCLAVMRCSILLLGNVILVTVSQQSFPNKASWIENILPNSPSEPCPINPSIITENRNNPACKAARTGFCFRNNCRRCCYLQNSCNPYPGLLVRREKCKNDLCGPVRCPYPGEYCDLTKDNTPRCHCPASCPDDDLLQPVRVCGTDGITYASECDLNKTACMLGAHIYVKFTGPCDLERRHLLISPLHQNTAILEVNEPGKLLCSLLGTPISITWSKIEMDSLPPRMIPMKETLVIPQVRIADEGIYRCEAYDGSSVVEAFVNVTVEYDAENMGDLDFSKRPKASCLLPRRHGYCSQHEVRWYFDVQTRTCQPFVYSGCGRNENNFKTAKHCRAACGHWAGDICKLPKRIGPCEAHIPKWYFHKDSNQCKKFVYGGCRGNANRFSSKMSCEVRCKAQKGLMSPCIKLYMDAVKSHRRGLFRPRCTADGRFQKTQCHDSVCFCMDEHGVEMHGTRVPNGQFINCTTRVHRCLTLRKNIKDNHFSSQHVPQCKQDGTYENVQCSPLTGQCWCVDAAGYEMIGTRTRTPLTCPTLDAELTHCQRNYIETYKSPRPGQFVTQCADDGRYRAVQCLGDTSTCSCVDRETGEEQSGTEISITVGKPQCQSSGGLTICQRMHQEAIKHPEMSQFIPQCTADGRFEHVQCDPDSKACWCVDKRGMEMVGSKVQGNIICPDIDSKLSPCQRRYQHAMKRLSYKINHHAPRCKSDGSYDAVQCHGRACHCVDDKGVEIPHTRVYSVARTPNCTHPDANLSPCERARHVAMTTSKSVPRCKPDGSWQTIQCQHTTRECWCLGDGAKEIVGTRTKGSLTCSHGDTKGQCWTEYVMALRSSRRSRRLPWCRKDGSYNPMQCHGSFCYCVMANGAEISGSKLSVAAGRPNCHSSEDSLTQCQLQYHGAMLSGFMGGHVPRCKSDGQYEEVQCQAGASVCWCVDENGNELPGTRTTKDIMCPVIGGALSPCQRMYLDYARDPSADQIKPRCTLGGEFNPVQCKQSFCFCVDENGQEIPGTRLRHLVGIPACNRENNNLTPCQREVHNAQEKLPLEQRHEPRCKQDGSYEEVQCSRVNGQCWCVDGQGHEVTKTRTTGYVKCPSAGHSLTPCQKEYQDVLRRSLLPHTVPQCTIEGRYEPVQCRENYCYCVNNYGVEIAYSRVDSSSDDRPNCQPVDLGPTLCQRQLQMYIRSEDHRQFEPSCNPDGSFRDIQCYGAQCYCVDGRGVEIQGTRKNFIDGKPNCERTYLSLTSCQQYLQESILSLSNASRFVPRCNKDGHFEPVQCSHLIGYCWCVDIHGKEIRNTRTRGTPQCGKLDLSSSCWRNYIITSNTSLPGSFTPWCTKDGEYEPIQTQGSRYFCVNDLGLEVLGTSVSVMEEKPNCRAAVSPGFIPSPCQREQIRQMYSPKAAGNYIPHCKTDGSYDEIQCDAGQGQCWCVDKDGQELDGMRTTGMLICPSDAPLSRCQVQREKSLRVLSLDSTLQLFVPRCKSDGGFKAIQCHGLTGQCWCVDINGNEIAGSATMGDKPDCNRAAKMSSCDRNRVVAMGLTGKPSPGRYVPQCTHHGKYKDVQCHAGTGLCWCADQEGQEIIGTRIWGHPQCQEMPTENDFPLDIAILYPPPSTDAALRSMQTFLRSLVSLFDVSPRGTHFSFVAFSEKVSSTLCLSSLEGKNLTKDNINKIIDKMATESSITRLDRALQFVDQEIFTSLSGMRSIALKVLIVVMDKKQTRDQGRYIPLSIASEDLKSKDVIIYSIGIRSRVDLAELMDVASRPGNVFTVDDFQSLALNGREIVDVVKNDTRDAFRVEKQCNLAVQLGRRGCLASLPAWYYNSVTGQCLQFKYSGCGGNANNFVTHEKCRKTCGGVLPLCYEVQRRRITKSLDHYRPSCRPHGDYSPIQCYGSSGYCWCSDNHGDERPHTRVQGTPVCSIPEKSTACLEERRQALGRLGVPSIGRHAPECNSNGKYHAIQSNGNSEYRWCVDSEGYPVAGTQRWGTPNCTDVVRVLRSHRKAKTKCEMERIKSELIDDGRRLFKPECTKDGDYEEIQCYKRVCWCVDHHSNEIIGSRQRGAPNCTQVASLSPCHREYKRSMILRGVTPLGYFLPQCKSNGQFESAQCHSATGYCWCVDENGNELVESRQWGKPNCTNGQKKTICQSRREECQDNQLSSHFIPKCTENGAFEDVQCLESMGECWCVDHYGYEMAGTRTSSHYRPNCTLLAWLSPCQIQRRKALGPDGLPVVGLFIPECGTDGSYEPVQCHPHLEGEKVCWCVDSQGVEIEGSRRLPGVRPNCGEESLCKSLQREYSSPNSSSRFVPKCLKNGNFAPSQCRHSTDMPGICWCVDEYGNEIHKTLSSKKQNCSAVGLTVCQYRHNQALMDGKTVVPRCDSDGSYAPTQCDSNTNHCWCVDRFFKEKTGSKRREKADCESREDMVVCSLPADAGPCQSSLLRWYFNSTSKTCNAFMYGGCVGNENKFVDYRSCQEQCKGTPLTPCQQARSLSKVKTNKHTPKCNSDGSYQPIQCNHVTKECWCVRKGGQEIIGSKTTNSTTPICPGMNTEKTIPASAIHGRKWLNL